MDQKQAIADRLKQANNILVTVSTNPSVDQLASCIGLALALNKAGKHATAVFSGAVPSTIEFLQPEKTLEKNTDSLRDFIISLDKSKADKLRYKVEDKVVKIFITPYKTSISDKDLEFSQGDFNVDIVIALGVHNQADLDQAITAHGRILHDAAVATINTKPGGELGNMNWLDPHASSLSEMSVELIDIIDRQLMDGQMATAFLTGIVAETKRFSNDRTSPITMSISAELMSAGANQQLVATKLEEPKPIPPAPKPVFAPNPTAPVAAGAPAAAPVALKNEAPKDDGTIEISHPEAPKIDLNAPTEDETPKEPDMPQINIDEQGALYNLRGQPAGVGQAPMLPKPSIDATTDPTHHMDQQHMILQPPTMGGQLTANITPDYLQAEHDDPLSTDPTNAMPLLSRDEPSAPPAGTMPAGDPATSTFVANPAISSSNSFAPTMPPLNPPPTPAAPAPLFPTTPPPAAPAGTLSQIEQDVNSPHVQATAPTAMPPDPDVPFTPTPQSVTPPDVGGARDAVMQAIAGQPPTPTPIQALNAQPFGAPLRDQAQQTMPPDPVIAPTQSPAPGSIPGTPPPPVPPPMMPV